MSVSQESCYELNFTRKSNVKYPTLFFLFCGIGQFLTAKMKGFNWTSTPDDVTSINPYSAKRAKRIVRAGATKKRIQTLKNLIVTKIPK